MNESTRQRLTGAVLIVSGLLLGAYGFRGLTAQPRELLMGSFALLLALLALFMGVDLVRGRSSLTAWITGRIHALWRLGWGLDPAATGPHPNTTQPMGSWTVRVLMVYLMGIFFMGAWTTWTVWTAVPSVQAADSAALGVATATGTGTAGVPRIDSLRPAAVAYGVGRPAVRIYGSGFADNAVTRLDGEPHGAARFVTPGEIVVPLGDVDFRYSGPQTVTVTVDTLTSNALAFTVRSAAGVTVRWDPRIITPRHVSAEARLLLLVFLMGALGGAVASFNSLASYRGEGKLTKSWFLHYWVSPFLGAGVAFFLYVVVRAGFLSGTNVQIDAGSAPWGLLAISGLAGLFYDKTLLKLREVFVTLFNPRDDRGGKIHQEVDKELAITSTSLRAATKGRTYRARLEAEGGHPEYSWSVQPDLPPGLALDPLTGVVAGTPTETSPLTKYAFTVSDMRRRTAKATLNLEVR